MTCVEAKSLFRCVFLRFNDWWSLCESQRLRSTVNEVSGSLVSLMVVSVLRWKASLNVPRQKDVTVMSFLKEASRLA